MFEDSPVKILSCTSDWKKKTTTTEAQCQTKWKEMKKANRSNQSIKTADAEVQAQSHSSTELQLAESVPPGLIEFLNKCEPLIHKELERNVQSHAFDGYDVTWNEELLNVTCRLTLHDTSIDEHMECTGLDWNSTGSVIAVAYGRQDHENWCTHNGSLGLWNVDRQNIDVHKPDHSIDTSVCLISIAFHPSEPTIIAGGLFSGEVFVWDLGQDIDFVLASSDEVCHREPVSQVCWIVDPASRIIVKHQLISTSSDGKILRWQMPSRRQSLKLVAGYMLLGGRASLSIRESSGSRECGISAVSFSKKEKSVFVLGSENGSLFECSLDKTSTSVPSVEIPIEILSLETNSLEQHHNWVSSVHICPHSGVLLLSSSLDGTTRIYNSSQGAAPIFTVDPGHGAIHCASWSASKPATFAAVTEDGHLLLYDLSENLSAAVQKLKASPDGRPVHRVAFNASQFHLLATGDKMGMVNIWQLSDSFALSNKKALLVLNKFVEVTTKPDSEMI